MVSDKAMAALNLPPPQSEVGDQPWIKRLLNVAKGILLVGVIVLASFWLVSAIVDISVFEVYRHFIGTIKTRLRIDTFLANALSLVLLIPFALGVRYYLFSFRNATRRNTGLAILVSMGVLYNLALYLGTRSENFGPDGEASKFYALVPGGVVFSDRSGTEAKYGVAFRPVTPENIRWLVRIKEGRVESVADPAHHDWFDGITRDPLLWYYVDSSSKFHFFDGPGYAPSSGDKLQPVTPEVRGQWEIAARESSTGTNPTPVARKVNLDSASPGRTTQTSTTEALASPPVKSDRDRRLDEFRSLVNTNIGLVTGKRNVGVLITASGPEGRSIPEQLFYGHLRADGTHFLTDLFRQDLTSGGYFDDLYGGDQEMRRIVAKSAGVDAVILGRLSYRFRKDSPSGVDLFICEIDFNYKTLSANGDVEKNDNIRAVGPGYAESVALERAVEELTKDFGNKVLKAP